MSKASAMYFLHFIFLLLLPPAPASSHSSVTLPGCPDRCGDLPISYPFGIGSNCSLHPSFSINCDNSSDPYVITPQTGQRLQVIEIKESEIRVKYNFLLNIACYDESGKLINITKGDSWLGINLRGSQYTFSEENWLTAIGCDDMVLGLGEGDVTFGGGCASFCGANITHKNGVGFCRNTGSGNAPGNGCCRTPVPSGIVYLGAQFMDLSRKWRSKKLFACSYAFVEERVVSDVSNFSYPLSYLNRRKENQNYTWDSTIRKPVFRLDWRIGTENCNQSKNNPSTYACRNNSKCVDVGASGQGRSQEINSPRAKRNFPGSTVPWTGWAGRPPKTHRNLGYSKQNFYTLPGKTSDPGTTQRGFAPAYDNIQGYHCHCAEGYQGNPYLINGCQDIDECNDEPCAPNSKCINSPGSFSCSCNEGYYGDGMATGFGCTRLPTPKNTIAIGLGSGIGLLLLLSICFWSHKKFIQRRQNLVKQKFFKQNGGLLLQQKTNEGTIRKTKHFPAKELEKATDNFNKTRILGQGGQGTVYKGILSDGKFVAIKKLKKVDEDQLEQFINEIVILSQIDHRNIVKLLGCCLENEVPLLLYEFVPHGTLFNLIHDHDAEFQITWNMRLKIAADISGALSYLHFSVSTPIYHRDIKSSNILLGEKFVVKVSDFGTSKSVEVDKTHLTTLVRGTFGYLDPEYFRSGQFTDKSDVYSFGVVLVELLTGQKPISSEGPGEERSLVMLFLASMEQDKLESILDPLVTEHGLKEEVIAVARLAQRCLDLQGRKRPSMKEVATLLANYSNMAQMSSTARDELEEARAYKAKPMPISDMEYTWTSSTKSEYFSSSDAHPLMSEVV